MNYRQGWVIGLLISLWSNGVPSAGGAAPIPGQPEIREHAQGLTITWSPPAPEITASEIQSDGKRYARPAIPGLLTTAQPGAPELPVFSRLIALPPEGAVSLRVAEIQTESVPLPLPPFPVPVPVPSSGIPRSEFRPDPQLYAGTAFYPAANAALGAPQWVRDQLVALLTLSPLRVDPSAGRMEVVRSIRVEISFAQPPAPPAPASQTGPFAAVLPDLVLNPHQLSPGAPPDPETQPSVLQPRTPPGLPLKISLVESGLYEITGSALQNAGVSPAALDPQALRLHHGPAQEAIALQLEGMADGIFDSGDRILFYADPAFSRYTDVDVYWLTADGLPGTRIGHRSGDPTGLPAGIPRRTARAEINRAYDSFYAGRDGDHWFWADLRRPGGNNSMTATLPLDSPLITGPDAALTLWLQGYTDPPPAPDHRIAVKVNGISAGEFTWNGTVGVTQVLTLPASRLRSGPNAINLTLPGLTGVTVEGLWVDALALTYSGAGGGNLPLEVTGEPLPHAYSLAGWPTATLAVYDITDSAAPQWITGTRITSGSSGYTLTFGDASAGGRRYLIVPEGRRKTPLALEPALPLVDPPGGADYIIVAPPELLTATLPLAAHYTDRGLRVVTVEVNAVYDTFGAGRLSPEALRDFLRHAYVTWTAPAPTYVLLVGDGTSDFKQFGGTSPENVTRIPPYLAPVDPWLGETAADNRYVSVSGDDALPDMLLGRLPVKTAAEAQTAVQKILQYQTQPLPGEWNRRVVLVSDDTQDGLDFAAANAAYAAVHVTDPFTVVERSCAGASPSADDCPATDAQDLHAKLLSDWNQGALLLHFNGHASWQQWAAERFFHLDDLPALSNVRRWPIAVEMTCFTGGFQRPEPTLDEDLVTATGGAIAAWGATGLGIDTGHNALTDGFYRLAFSNPAATLGAATLAGKVELAATGRHLDLLDTYTLLGDPALPFNRTLVPWNTQAFLPLVQRAR